MVEKQRDHSAHPPFLSSSVLDQCVYSSLDLLGRDDRHAGGCGWDGLAVARGLLHHDLLLRGHHGLHGGVHGVGGRVAARLQFSRLLAERTGKTKEVRAAVAARVGLQVVLCANRGARREGEARRDAAAQAVEPEEGAAVGQEVPGPADGLLVLSEEDGGDEIPYAARLALVEAPADAAAPRLGLSLHGRHGAAVIH